MTIKIQKPILIAGVSISFLLWFWQRIQASFSHLEEFSLWGLIALGVLFWWWKPQTKNSLPKPQVYIPITKAVLEKAFQECDTLLNQLILEKGITTDLETQLNSLKTSPDVANQKLQCAIIGRNKSGKSTLKKILEFNGNLADFNFIETEISSSKLILDSEEIINPSCLKSDLLLFVINGDLTDSEWQIIQKITIHNQRLLLIFNQKDRYSEDEQIIILKQLQETVKLLINQEDIISITTSPLEIKVKKYQQDGIIKEWKEKPQSETKLLVNRLNKLFENEKESLLLATTYRQVITLKNKLKNRLNQVRKTKSLPVIEQYQLIAAAATFANPVSSLDLIATAAINAQMLVDLSNIYQRKLSLEQAKTASFTIGKLMVKLGIVEFSTQTLGSILKTNVVTYIAGGAVQGVSAAYLTRLAGLSLIEYFQTQQISNDQGLNIDQFKQKIQAIFQANKKEIFLQDFVKTTVKKLVVNT